MKIAVLGAGAMGSLFGGYLSKYNDVWLVDVDPQRVNAITQKGITIVEKDGEQVFWPKAVTSTSDLGEMDLVIVFVKAMATEAALSQNRHLVGKDMLAPQARHVSRRETISASCSLMWGTVCSPLYSWMSFALPMI